MELKKKEQKRLVKLPFNAGKKGMLRKQTDVNTKLPVERFLKIYVSELGRKNPDSLIDDGDGIFIEESAVLDLAQGLLGTTYKRGVCFLN